MSNLKTNQEQHPNWGGKREGSGRKGRGRATTPLTFRVPIETKRMYEILKARGIAPSTVASAIKERVWKLYNDYE